MKEKWVTIYIDNYPRSCPESKVPQVLENIERLKERYLQKGVSQELLNKMYTVRIVKDED